MKGAHDRHRTRGRDHRGQRRGPRGAVTREFTRRGAPLGLLARGRVGLDAAQADAERLGAPEVTCVAADVADTAQAKAAAAKLEAELGPARVWVNNAMTSVFAPVWEITAEEYRRVAEVICLGYVHCTLAALARMRPRDRARSARRWPTAGPRCRLPTAPPSTPSRASTTRSAPTCTTPAAGSG